MPKMEWFIDDPVMCAETDESLKSWYCEQVVDLLVPHLAPTFPRSRWTGADATLVFSLLLAGAHGLLPELVARWLGKTPVVAGAGADEWSDWSDDGAGPHLSVVAHGGDEDSAFSWAEQNAQARGDALGWSNARGTPARLFIMQIAMTPAFTLMHSFLELAGQAFDLKQQALAATSQLLVAGALGRQGNADLSSSVVASFSWNWTTL